MQQECRFRDMRNHESESGPSDQEMIRTVDHNSVSEFRGSRIQKERTQCNKNPDFAICEIASESGPSYLEMIRIVYETPRGVW
jgi:hypothetical protein